MKIVGLATRAGTAEVEVDDRGKRPDRAHGDIGTSAQHRGEFDLIPRAETLPLKPTSFELLSDGALVEVVEYPDDPARTLLLVWRDGKPTYVEQLEDAGRILVPAPRATNVLRKIRLPKSTKPYSNLVLDLYDVVNRHVCLAPEYILVVVCFILATWFPDRLQVAPYLLVVGLPQSGKTTLLRLLSLVCRRPLLVTGDTSPASIYDIYSQLAPTLLIDENGSLAGAAELRRLLRAGTTRDTSSIVRGEARQAYGPKVIACIDVPNDPALNSRSFQITMTEVRHAVAPLSDQVAEELAEDFQARLLQFRLENYAEVDPQTVSGADELRLRSRDILSALLAPLRSAQPEFADVLRTVFGVRDAFEGDCLPVGYDEVVTSVFRHVHQKSFAGGIMISAITKEANLRLEANRQPLRLTGKKTGRMLTMLGFDKHSHTSRGTAVLLDRDDLVKLHHLIVQCQAESAAIAISNSNATCPACPGQKETTDTPAAKKAAKSTTDASPK